MAKLGGDNLIQCEPTILPESQLPKIMSLANSQVLFYFLWTTKAGDAMQLQNCIYAVTDEDKDFCRGFLYKMGKTQIQEDGVFSQDKELMKDWQEKHQLQFFKTYDEAVTKYLALYGCTANEIEKIKSLPII